MITCFAVVVVVAVAFAVIASIIAVDGCLDGGGGNVFFGGSFDDC